MLDWVALGVRSVMVSRSGNDCINETYLFQLRRLLFPSMLKHADYRVLDSTKSGPTISQRLSTSIGGTVTGFRTAACNPNQVTTPNGCAATGNAGNTDPGVAKLGGAAFGPAFPTLISRRKG